MSSWVVETNLTRTERSPRQEALRVVAVTEGADSIEKRADPRQVPLGATCRSQSKRVARPARRSLAAPWEEEVAVADTETVGVRRRVVASLRTVVGSKRSLRQRVGCSSTGERAPPRGVARQWTRIADRTKTKSRRRRRLWASQR